MPLIGIGIFKKNNEPQSYVVNDDIISEKIPDSLEVKITCASPCKHVVPPKSYVKVTTMSPMTALALVSEYEIFIVS
jgi:hypothetical protein